MKLENLISESITPMHMLAHFLYCIYYKLKYTCSLNVLPQQAPLKTKVLYIILQFAWTGA